MQTDDEPPAYFASGSAGTQGAPWMTESHVYTFILQYANGTEVARARFTPSRNLSMANSNFCEKSVIIVCGTMRHARFARSHRPFHHNRYSTG
jgi:hypothetical protein